jgi:hypothetical protein
MVRIAAVPFRLALISIAMFAAAVVCGSSAGKPTAPPRTFVSKHYGFSVILTTDWTAADAVFDWNGNKLEGLASPDWARFNDAARGRTLVAAAARVAKRTRLASWRAAMVRAAPSFCSDSKKYVKTMLDGEPAAAWTTRCSDGYDVYKLAALHGTRGYMILLGSRSTNGDAQDRGVFESIRRSFRFTR